MSPHHKEPMVYSVIMVRTIDGHVGSSYDNYTNQGNSTEAGAHFKAVRERSLKEGVECGAVWARTQLAESVAVAYSTTDTHSLAHQQSINYHGLCVNNDPVVHKYMQLRAQCLPCAIQKKRQNSAKTEERREVRRGEGEERGEG